MATYKGDPREDESVRTEKEGNPRVLRRFVERGGKLVEVEAVVRETR